jgi:2-amino-4-hydroxy-6-hydroxymethyldihydropteridine diphosphokinase
MRDNNVYIAFGSNKGNALNNIKAAIAALGKLGQVTSISPLFKTKPEGFLEQEDFINGALCLATPLAPQELLAELKNIESALGRKPAFKNAPREIDLDIIFYKDIILNTPALQIPHPLCHKREFVLLPLSFIAADFIHPANNKSVKVLLNELMTEKQSSCQKLDDSLL